jgi:hypothetical protein
MIIKKGNYYYFLKWIKMPKKRQKTQKNGKKTLKKAKNDKK